jgi:hypothetical protein
MHGRCGIAVHFVASMPAPVASGWSESPGGPRTHWKAPPCHGAPPLPSFPMTDANVSFVERRSLIILDDRPAICAPSQQPGR